MDAQYGGVVGSSPAGYYQTQGSYQPQAQYAPVLRDTPLPQVSGYSSQTVQQAQYPAYSSTYAQPTVTPRDPYVQAAPTYGAYAQQEPAYAAVQAPAQRSVQMPLTAQPQAAAASYVPAAAYASNSTGMTAQPQQAAAASYVPQALPANYQPAGVPASYPTGIPAQSQAAPGTYVPAGMPGSNPMRMTSGIPAPQGPHGAGPQELEEDEEPNRLPTFVKVRGLPADHDPRIARRPKPKKPRGFVLCA